MSKRETSPPEIDLLDNFFEYMDGYHHMPTVDTGCEFGEHWWCGSCDWKGYSLIDALRHIKDMWEKDRA